MKAKRIIIAFLLVSLFAPPCAVPALAAERESEPGLYLIYADIQAEQTMTDSSYGWWCYPATHSAGQLWSSDLQRPDITADGIF